MLNEISQSQRQTLPGTTFCEIWNSQIHRNETVVIRGQREQNKEGISQGYRVPAIQDK